MMLELIIEFFYMFCKIFEAKIKGYKHVVIDRICPRNANVLKKLGFNFYITYTETHIILKKGAEE